VNRKKNIYSWLLIGCMLLQPFWLTAQSFNFTVYREADGLPGGYIQKAFEDSRGYLWLCTFGGLSRFDGRNFKNYDIKDGLPGNFCDDICEDKKGNLWIGTRQGLCYFDGKKFTSFGCPDSMATAYFASLKTDENNTFSCQLNGRNAIVKDGKLQYINLLKELPAVPERSCVVDTLANGTWILNSSQGIYILTKEKLLQHIFRLSSNITCFNFHKTEKNAFYFFNEKGIYHWQDGILKKLADINFNKQIITALFVDRQKRVWITTEGKGVWIINNGKITFIDKSALPGYLVTSFYQDKRGVMWICTFRGLVKLTDQFVTHFSLAKGLDNEDIRSSHKLADGSICMQTTIIKKGYPALLPGNLSRQLEYKNFKNYISNIQIDHKKRWWIFAQNGELFRWEKGLLNNVTPQYGYASGASTLFDENDNSLWFAYKSGIGIVKDDTISKRITSLADGTALNRIISINKDYFGHIWVSEVSRLLLLTNRGLVDFTPNLGLHQKFFADIACSDHNGVWIKTRGLGAIHLSFTNNTWIKDKMINADNGLPGNYIHDIKTDNKQNIWIATLTGLYRFTENKNVPTRYNVRTFTKAEGIDVPNWNLAFLETDSLQNVWLGVANGIFKINTPAINEFVFPPAVLIDNVRVLNSDNAENQISNGFKTDHSSLYFSYRQNDIGLYFNGINLNNSFIQYAYMLKARDESWVSYQKNSEAIYYNLSPGKYTFMVKAINDSGLESKVSAYSFTIVPPFWQTGWFRLLVALLAIAIIYWFIKKRDALREKDNLVALQMSELKLTALQSQMNPHFIFNSLNSIQNYILQQKPVDAARYLSKFSKLMRRILDQSFNNLTPLNEIVQTLRMYMELEAFRFSNEFSWQVKVENSESISDVKLPPLLLQPYVENAIIHGLMPKDGNKQLLILIYIKENILHCVIDDNGVGRGNKLAPAEGHISHGQKLTTDILLTMKQLLHSEAQIIITDKKDEQQNATGTKIDLIIPVGNNK
jgi:ligand-binding sensor domain-containing protein